MKHTIVPSADNENLEKGFAHNLPVSGLPCVISAVKKEKRNSWERTKIEYSLLVEDERGLPHRIDAEGSSLSKKLLAAAADIRLHTFNSKAYERSWGLQQYQTTDTFSIFRQALFTFHFGHEVFITIRETEESAARTNGKEIMKNVKFSLEFVAKAIVSCIKREEDRIYYLSDWTLFQPSTPCAPIPNGFWSISLIIPRTHRLLGTHYAYGLRASLCDPLRKETVDESAARVGLRKLLESLEKPAQLEIETNS